MSILSSSSLQCFSIFQRSMIQANELPLCEVLDSSLFAEAFQEDNVVFGIADEDVFTPAIKWTRAQRPKWMSKREYRRTPEFIEMRLSDVAVDTPGSRSEGFTIATTLLNVDEHPGAWLGSMYEGRWIVEPDIVPSLNR